MSQHDIPLALLFRVLPRTAELAGLREAILAASIADPRDEWKGSSEHGTLDRRVIRHSMLNDLFAEAEERSIRHVRAYHRLLRDALRQAASDEGDDALRELQRLGEESSDEGRWEACVSYYGAVAAIASETGAADLEVLARRRMGRAHLHLGHPARAARWYASSLHSAEVAGDREGSIIAQMGLGHAYAVEGRWSDALAAYLRSRELCQADDAQLRTQTSINLSMASRELGDLAGARRWLQDARSSWEVFGPAERSVCLNNEGLLALAEGRISEAREAFENALADAPSHHDRAMILDNIAETRLREGILDEAETFARAAEDYAIAGASARALADIYIRLGRIRRAQRDPNGVTFFEKAIQICQENGYLLSEATACTEYSLFRMTLGDEDEARGLRERAELLLKRIDEHSPSTEV